jgi:[ribosomal protein S18]-alanine N-acetyltransferase
MSVRDSERANVASTPYLRVGTAADSEALVAIDGESTGGGWSAEAFAHELTLAWSRTLVAEDASSGGIVGFIVFWLGVDEAEILNVAVRVQARRRGIGRALVEAAANDARMRQASRLLLEVRSGNHAAQALYRSLGFVQIGLRRGYYQREHEDAVLMELKLGD